METSKYEESVRQIISDACRETRRRTIHEVLNKLLERNEYYDNILRNALKISTTTSGSRFDKLWSKYLAVSRKAQAEAKIIQIISEML